ncbi:MAG: hypothetical protein A3F24_02845 [Candidatus Colwellbacteria bacterium RIFCSPHIGHO2_12_FULL_44_17]|uniref:VanZ-like domain-containing protein n=2 Tax=Candidatus Colwelliibacteriota TaxID=1817904 RepID=A0A1G1Z643_9BACT|nr:MAG: hypothetical protein A3F24_02845 [Candidatus Colwellbacteria bacterium RIFCSPHIGHO2_12_FULL_44_17]OGY60083.1 MAG: hypothetical protein A3I31_03025 [Candidatus Colwellbacteria bacterium RIFCSPLOWO2_02_FULL_44_20b]
MGNGVTTLGYAPALDIIESRERPKKVKTSHLISLFAFGAVLDYLARKYGWYFIVRQLDVPMHVGGGILVGLFFFWLSDKWQKEKKHRSQRAEFVLRLIVFIAFVALGTYLWEIFEYARYPNIQISAIDTFADIVFGFVGAGLTVIVRKVRRMM